MSQPRRRRRRRRRGGRAGAPEAPPEGADESRSAQAVSPAAAQGAGSRRRRRRGARPAQGSPRSSEDLVRALERPDRSSLSAVPDGRTLEGVIGELQSLWGVPQNPQEYRITLKVAEERDGRGERVAIEEVREEPRARPGANGAPRREKAPAAPRIGAGLPEEADEPGAARRRRGRRRRRTGRRKPGNGS
jgi:hypothetical protein